MIFADKLIRLRKKMGLSQEELAFKMNVSRQAVSKWESSMSIPDLDNVLQLSTLFNVSTDFLLKDELETEELVNEEALVRVLLLDEVNDYLEYSKTNALKISLGTLLCILSPLVLIVLCIFSDHKISLLSSALAVLKGLITLFVFVVTAIVLFITTSFSKDKYNHITKQDYALEFGATSIIKNQKNKFRSRYNACILTGVILCVLSPIALLISAFVDNLYAITFSLMVLFLMIAIAVFMFVFVTIRWESFNTVLKEEEYKVKNKREAVVSRVIWLSATVLYLTISFTFGYWNLTWIIWIIAALIQAIVLTLGKDE